MELLNASRIPRPALRYPDDDASTASACSVVDCYKFAPSNLPAPWAVINMVLFLWSLILFVEISTSSSLDGPGYRLEDTRLYFVWNFGTTIIWCLEVTLTVLARADDENWQDSWPITMELLLAIYFTFDSIYAFRKWNKAHGEKPEAELFDTAISTIAYLYLLVKAKPWNYLRCSSRPREQYELIV